MSKSLYESAPPSAMVTQPIKASELMRVVPEKTETIFELVEEVDGAGKNLTVTNRELQPEPVEELEKARSPRRAFVFHDVESFKAYIEVNRTVNSVVLADAGSLNAIFVYDENAKDGFEVAVYKPTIHPLLALWEGSPWIATEFAQFLIENRKSVVAGYVGDEAENGLQAREIAMLFRQVRTSKSITIESGSGKNAINGVMCEVKIGSSVETHQISIELPDSIRVRLPIFVTSEDESELDFDLFVYNDERDKVKVSATNSELESLISREFIAEMTSMRESLSGSVLVAFGQFNTFQWDVVGDSSDADPHTSGIGSCNSYSR